MPEESVLSGLTVEELGAGHTPAGRIRAELDRLKVPARRVDPAKVEFMLAEPRDEAFNKAGWVFEPKLDGYRALATHDGGAPALKSRNGNDLTPSFPDVARAVRALPVSRAVIDGELVIPIHKESPVFRRCRSGPDSPVPSTSGVRRRSRRRCSTRSTCWASRTATFARFP